MRRLHFILNDSGWCRRREWAMLESLLINLLHSRPGVPSVSNAMGVNVIPCRRRRVSMVSGGPGLCASGIAVALRLFCIREIVNYYYYWVLPPPPSSFIGLLACAFCALSWLL